MCPGPPLEAPFCLYYAEIDFLDVICGEGCTSWTSVFMGPMLFHGVDLVRKMHPEPDEDTFAGLQTWGGVQNFLSHNYKRILREYYEGYRLEHNSGKRNVPVSDIVHFLLEDDRGLVLPEWFKWEGRVMQALQE